MPSSSFSGPRAGFWRRVLAFALDCLLVGAVVSIIGLSAFSLTGGRVQVGGVGVNSVSCVGTASILANLDPAPPDGSNHAEICDEGALPLVVSKRFLRVGRRTEGSERVVDVDQSYPLSTSGVPIAATDLTWIFQVGFFVYIVGSLVSGGRTLGMRLIRIRLVVPSFEAGRVGVPFSRLLSRVCVVVAGFLPAVAALIWVLIAPESTPVGPLVLATIVMSLGWVGWNIVLIARKEDPVYDHVAGLAVLIEQPGTVTGTSATE